jgi:hypothetical protein
MICVVLLSTVDLKEDRCIEARNDVVDLAEIEAHLSAVMKKTECTYGKSPWSCSLSSTMVEVEEGEDGDNRSLTSQRRSLQKADAAIDSSVPILVK